jgi:hypothetical protein
MSVSTIFILATCYYFKIVSSLPIESAMPLLRQNISANTQYYGDTSTSPNTLVLDWDDEELSENVKNLGELDAIMYVCFENVDCNLTSIFGQNGRCYI